MNRRSFLFLLFILYAAAGAAAAFLYTIKFSGIDPLELEKETLSLSAPSGFAEEANTREEAVLQEAAKPVESADAPKPEEPAEVESPAYTYQVSPIHRRLMIRSGPSLDAPVIGYLRAGDTGDVLDMGGDTDEWVLLTDGQIEGYSFKAYLIFTEKEE